MLDKVKLALRITTDIFDDELNLLISASADDLALVGVSLDDYDSVDEYPNLVQRAIITYSKMNFGEPSNYDKLKASYDEQKAQLRTATGYTDWGDV